MTKTIVYLARHGQTRWNVERRAQGLRRVPLNESGRKQARRLARFFQKVMLDKVYASPALRARQTAKIIAPKQKILVSKGFRERELQFHDGLTLKQVKKIIPDIEQQWERDGIDWKPPGGGETLREFQKRAVKAFKQLINQNKGKQVLVVTHGSVMKAVTHWLHDGKPEGYLRVRKIQNAEVVRVVLNGKKSVRRIKTCVK